MIRPRLRPDADRLGSRRPAPGLRVGPGRVRGGRVLPRRAVRAGLRGSRDRERGGGGLGQDDLNHPVLAGMLDLDVTGMLHAAATDPMGFEASFAASADADLMWRLITETSSEVDLAVYTDPAFETAYRRSLGEGFSQGAEGYARDLVLVMGHWPFDLGEISVPVDLWYGGHDTSTVHSPDHGAVLACRIPTARRHFLPDAGGSLLWTHAEEILESLLSAGCRPKG